MSSRVLIIDDDLNFKRLLEIRLKTFLPDLAVTHFATLGQARESFSKESPSQYDLILLDEHLPDGKGVTLLKEGSFDDLAVLCVSSDHDPELPGRTILAGATYFLNKSHVSQPLFRPLVEGIIDRNKTMRELRRIRTQTAVMESVRTLIMTLRHEINNPLGAVLGAAFLLNRSDSADPSLKEAAKLVETSGQRIKHVLEQLCNAVSLDMVNKGGVSVFHVPGDKAWDSGSKKE